MKSNRSRIFAPSSRLKLASLFGLVVIILNIHWLGRVSSAPQQTPSFVVYIANTGSDTVSVVDFATGAPLGSPIHVGAEPSAIAVSPDQRRVYVANSQTNTVSVIDTETHAVVDTIQLRRTSRAIGLVVSFDGKRLYVTSDQGNIVYAVNTDTNNVIGLPISVQGSPMGIGYTDNPDPRLFISTPGNQGVTNVDVSGLVTRRTIETGQNPFGVAMASDGATAYVADLTESKVSAIATRTNELLRSVSVGNQPDSLGITADRRRLVVASLKSPMATILNPVDGAFLSSLPTGSSSMTGRPGLNRLGLAPDGLNAVVANEDNDTVSLIDLRTGVVRHVAALGDSPTGVVVVGRVAVCDPAQTTVDFGDVRLGSGGAQQELVITNRGTETLQINGAVIDNPVFESSGTPLTIAPRESGRIRVRFTPTVLGEQQGTLRLQTNDPDPSRCEVQLRGFGRSPICTISPTFLDFGIVHIGLRGELPVIIGNSGNERLVINQVTSTDPQFGIVRPSLPVSVEPGSFQTVFVGFTPGAIRFQSALLRFIGNDPDQNRCILSVQGVGQGPVCRATDVVDFGEVPVFQTGFGAVMVMNVGDETLLLTNISVDDPLFRIQPPPLPLALAPNASVSFIVTFNPVRVEMRTANLRISSNDPGPRCVVSLRGTGKGPICDLSARTSFGDVPLGRPKTETVQITNRGNADLIIFNVIISGSSAFQLQPTSFPLTVRPGQSAALPVRFTPTFLGLQSATFAVQTNDPLNATCTSRLEGTGIAPPILAYVANNGASSVSVINVENGNPFVDPIGVPSGPTGIAKSPNGRFLYVTNFNSNSLTIIDVATNVVVDTVFIGGGPLGVAVSPNGDRVYVTQSAINAVAVINTASNSVLRTLRPISGAPAGIVVSPNGNRLYVTTPGDRTVTVVDPDTFGNPVITTIPVGPNSTALAISPGGGSVFVSDTTENFVREINTATNTVTRSIAAGDGAESLIVSLDGSRLYVVNLRANTLSVITTASGMTLTTVPVGHSAGTARLGPNRIALSNNGRIGVVANADDSTITVIDLANNQVLRTVTVGRTPLGVSVVGP